MDPIDLDIVLRWPHLLLIGVFTLQSLFLGVGFLLFNSRLRRLEARADADVRKLRSLLTKTEANLGHVCEVVRRFPDWEEQLRRAIVSAGSTIVETDAIIQGKLEGVENGLSRWQEQSDQVMARFIQASDEIHGAVVQPALRVSLFFRALSVGLTRFFSRDDDVEDPRESHPDEQIFI